MSKITQDEIEYARMCNLLKSELDYQSGMVEARRSGLKEGMEKGREEGLEIGHEKEKQIIAKNLLAEGSTPEFVHRITGLSIEEINNLV